MKTNVVRIENPYARRQYKQFRSGHVIIYIYRNPGIPCLTWAYRIKELYSDREKEGYHSAHMIGSVSRAIRKVRIYLIWRTITSPLYKLFES